MERRRRVVLYFVSWFLLALIAFILNFLNIDFSKTSYAAGIPLLLVLGIVQGSVLEYPIQTIACLIIGGHTRHIPQKDHITSTLIMNYNLLALSKEDVDDCLEMMYIAYMGNLSSNISAVLVSATGDKILKGYELFLRDYYRVMIFYELYGEGIAFSKREYNIISQRRLDNIWRQYESVEPEEFRRKHLFGICSGFSKEFMVIHRVSRVLRKCGQYQDLMLLSDGQDTAYTYCDSEYYGIFARKFGDNLFHESEDVSNIHGRKFDYTLVLDGDTCVPPGTAFSLLKIAEAHPNKGIIQPAIHLHCQTGDTLFMHLEATRQSLNEPLTNAIAAVFEQSSYFGKALIKNQIYIERVLGIQNNLIESVPVDVLSHDTFEAALLKPMYAGSVYLLEAPSYNYVTWGIRELRWNKGEILLAMYFWKNAFGKPMRWLQKTFQGNRFNKTMLRTECDLDFVTAYIAHSALRQMIVKPLLLVYIIIHIFVTLKWQYVPIIIIMFFVIVFPKFATYTRGDWKCIIMESLASILQFTPEAVTGCVRILRAFEANICAKTRWIPQRAIEKEFHNCNAFISSFKHLWGYSLVACIASILIIFFDIKDILLLVMFVTLIVLPLFTGITSLSCGCGLRHRTSVDIESAEFATRRNIYREFSDISRCSSNNTKGSSSGKISTSSGDRTLSEIENMEIISSTSA